MAVLDGSEHPLGPHLVVDDIPTFYTAHGKGKRAHINDWALRRWIIEEGPIDLAVLEKVGAMPGQGVTSMFRFGQAAGICQGILVGMNIKTMIVSPREWKKEMGVGREKDQARQIITSLYPSIAVMFKRKKDVDRAEAALLAVYGLRNNGAHP